MNRRASTSILTFLWGLLAAGALVWPDRVVGPFDGVPLDRTAEALLIGLLFPVLWWFHPRFLQTRLARALIVALAAWKLCSTLTFTQQGWCVRFEPQEPYVWDQTGAPHAWDVRADWRTPDPHCSAVMSRAYGSFEQFPAWFFNLPPPNNNWPGPKDRPPGATTRMAVRGYIHARAPGTLQFDRTPEVAAKISVDGGPDVESMAIDAGTHLVAVDAVLTGDRWRFVPQWNGADLWKQSALTATTRRPAAVDVRLGSWIRILPTLIVLGLLLSWAIAALADVRDPWTLGWSAAMSLLVAGLVLANRVDTARFVLAALVTAAVVPVSGKWQNLRGAFLLVGVPWLVFVAACAAPAVGRFVLYESGDDYWMFQRFAYRIVMQGYWLEGGSPTFWFQPLYRWIVGLLHVTFGDSSVGEWFWDGACLLAGSLFAFAVVERAAGFRAGIVAAVLPLAIFALGTPHYLIGRGLSEISSAGLIYLAAIFALRASEGSLRAALAAGIFATLGFYTRLNNLPMAFGVGVFAWRRGDLRPAATIAATIALGVLLFALRTWHYTGIFSVFYGTQRELLAIWQPGTSLTEGLRRTIDSVLMVLTVNDPPRFDVRAIPVLAGALIAVGAAARAPKLRDVPWRMVIFFLSAIVGAFITRGTAYAGRFSIHIIPIACAIAVSGVAVQPRNR